MLMPEGLCMCVTPECHVITPKPHRRGIHHSNMIQYVRTDFINGKPDGCQTLWLFDSMEISGSQTIPLLLLYCPHADQGTCTMQPLRGPYYICNTSHPTVNCIIGLIQLHLMHFIQFVPPSPLIKFWKSLKRCR